jgi:putative ABC transport system ATP-binding protein
MMNIVGCLDVATEGEYFIDGKEISKYSENQLAFLRNKTMGFIFQGFNLLSNMSAYENVELPLIYQGVPKAERKKRVQNALELVGMKERMKHKPTELSGGQQQRVAIARALATNPQCILADEPTGNLDSATGDEIMKILSELNKQGTTIIIITHNDEIASLSRRVVRIHDGKIESDTINPNVEGYGEKAVNPLVMDENAPVEVDSLTSEKEGV